MNKGRMRSFKVEGGGGQHLVVVPCISFVMCVQMTSFSRQKVASPCLITPTTSNTPMIPLTSSEPRNIKIRREREKGGKRGVCGMSGRGEEQSIYRYLMLTINILTKLTQTHTEIQTPLALNHIPALRERKREERERQGCS